MSHFKLRPRAGLRAALCLFFLGFLGAAATSADPVPTGKPDTFPDWWFQRGVVPRIDPNQAAPTWPVDYRQSDDYAVLTQGQLKMLATAAFDQLEEKFAPAGGAGIAVTDLVKSWFELDGSGEFVIVSGRRVPKTAGVNDFAAMNLGQLKQVAQPFYDRLIQLLICFQYPWELSPDAPDDFAVANLGQAKNLFRFTAATVDIDDPNRLPRWFERITGLHGDPPPPPPPDTTDEFDHDGPAFLGTGTDGPGPFGGPIAETGENPKDENGDPIVFEEGITLLIKQATYGGKKADTALREFAPPEDTSAPNYYLRGVERYSSTQFFTDSPTYGVNSGSYSLTFDPSTHQWSKRFHESSLSSVHDGVSPHVQQLITTETSGAKTPYRGSYHWSENETVTNFALNEGSTSSSTSTLFWDADPVSTGGAYRWRGSDEGTWQGPRTYNGVTTTANSPSLNRPNFEQRFGNGVWVSPTKIYYSDGFDDTVNVYSYTYLCELQQFYPTPQFIDDVVANRYDYPLAWVKVNPESTAAVAGYELNSDHDELNITQSVYKLHVKCPRPQSVTLLEVFVPNDDTSTPADERANVKVFVRTIPLPQGGEEAESKAIEIDSTIRGKNGTYRLLPFELSSDLNNDGKVGEGTDSSLKTAALQSGASDDAKEKGTEYVFVNDKLSNGAWDKEDSDPNKPASETKDDDAEELKTIFAATWGAIWFEFEGGDISKLEFWKNKECTEAFTFNPTFALSESNKLPEKLFVRTKGDWTAQVEGKLIMKLGKADKSETWAEDKLLFTVVKHLGDKKYFQAVRDYILENNTPLFVHDKKFPPNSANPSTTIRLCLMREEGTVMNPYETYHNDAVAEYNAAIARHEIPPTHPFDPVDWGAAGIDMVMQADTAMTVVINGNQCDFSNPTLPVDPTERLATLTLYSLNGEPGMTDKCHGRLVIGGVLNPSSNDHYDPNTVVAGTSLRGSYLAGPDPIPGTNSPGGKYVGQYPDGRFTMGAGRVPIITVPGTVPTTPVPQSAMGGLSGNYSSSDRNNYPNSMVGYAPMGGNGKGVIFVAMGINKTQGKGKVQEFYEAAKASDVPEIAGATPSNNLPVINLLFLDSGMTSCALAYENPAQTLKLLFKGDKHDGFPYYTNTFLRFKAQRPRSNAPQP